MESSSSEKTDLQTFYAFFIRTQFKKSGCAPPPAGFGHAYITISSLLLQLRNETNRKETLIISVN